MLYVSKPQMVEAIQVKDNYDHIWRFVGLSISFNHEEGKTWVEFSNDKNILRCYIGDWIIKDVKGNITICREEDFSNAYKKVTE